MTKSNGKIGSHKKLLQKLIDQKRDFTYKLTSKSVVIECNGHKTQFFPREMSRHALSLITSIKKNPIFEQYADPISRNQIKYFDFYLRKEGVFKNVVEIDINSAYWILAYKMGYISEEQYNKGLDLEKIERLSVLGSIARIQYIFQYIDGEPMTAERNVSANGRIAFFNICSKLGNIMSDIVNENGRNFFFFFWVDAFFCSSHIADSVVESIKSRGLDCKIKKMSSISVKKEKDTFKVFATQKGSKLRNSTNVIIKPFIFEEKKDFGNIDESIVSLNKKLTNGF